MLKNQLQFHKYEVFFGPLYFKIILHHIFEEIESVEIHC